MRSPIPNPSHLRPAALVVTLVLAVIALGSCRDATGIDDKAVRLAFLRAPSYNTLFVMKRGNGAIDEEIALPMAGGRVRMSPSGDRLAVTVGGELWVMGLDGSDKRLLATNAYNGTWSPDGMRLAYSGYPGPQLRIVNADGSGDVALPGTVPGGYGGIAWSPDGGRIAFEGMRGSFGTIYLVNVDGSGLQDLDLTLEGPERRSSGEPTWSPDGRRLAFRRLVVVDVYTRETGIWVANPATGDARRLTNNTGTGDVRPAWSPDGSRIAFLRFDGDMSDVFVVKPDGTGLQQITDTPSIREEDPQWIPE
jgi:Tol biopolymer transport system component